MKNAIFLLLFAATLGLFTCDKEQETVINGIVTDAKTGAPIYGATFNCTISKLGGGGTTNAFILHTDQDGRFHFSYKNGEGITGFSLSQTGYLERYRYWGEGVNIKDGEVNEINLVLHPLDGTLRLLFQNSQPEKSTLYVQGQTAITRLVFGNTRTILTAPYPREVPPNTTIQADYAFPADELVYVFWDVKNFDSLTPELAAFSDTLYLAKGDTAAFQINL